MYIFLYIHIKDGEGGKYTKGYSHIGVGTSTCLFGLVWFLSLIAYQPL